MDRYPPCIGVHQVHVAKYVVAHYLIQISSETLVAHHLRYPSALLPCRLCCTTCTVELYVVLLVLHVSTPEGHRKLMTRTRQRFHFSTALLTFDVSCLRKGPFSQFLRQLLRPWGRFISYAHGHDDGSLPTMGSVCQLNCSCPSWCIMMGLKME